MDEKREKKKKKWKRYPFVGSMSTMPHTFLLFTENRIETMKFFSLYPIGIIFTVWRLHFDESILLPEQQHESAKD